MHQSRLVSARSGEWRGRFALQRPPFQLTPSTHEAAFPSAVPSAFVQLP
jgi:hypothetical protein